MVRTKYEDTVYEKPVYSGKIFMYCTAGWNVLFPIVDVIRLLKLNTIIGHAYEKGQQTITMYGRQYNHNVIGYSLKTKKDYATNLRTIKNIFIFSDSEDHVATNLMNVAKKNKINVICYSNIDTIYHFYDYSGTSEKTSFKDPALLMDRMYLLHDYNDAKKFAELFDDFELIDPPVDTFSTLEQCTEKMKKIDLAEKNKKVHSKLFDPHLIKLKKMEYERSQANMTFPDSVENINKKELDKQKGILSRFFKI